MTVLTDSSATVIAPLPITGAILTSSSINEPDTGEANYNAGTPYAKDAIVLDPATHAKYISLAAANTGNTPATSPTWWFQTGYSNKWSMFDYTRNIQSSHASPLTVELTPGGRINALALLGLEATSVTVTMTSVTGGGTVYTKTENLYTREVFGWYDYFFQPFTTREALALYDLPPFSDCIITVVITNAAGAVKCSACVIGNAEYLGETERDADSPSINTSTFTRDAATTVVTLVARRTIPRFKVTVMADRHRANRLRRVRDDLNARPAVWSCIADDTDDLFETFLNLGVWQTFDIPTKADDPLSIPVQLEVESL